MTESVGRAPIEPVRRSVLGCGLLLLVLALATCRGGSDVSFFVLVKSSNWAQDSDGQLTLLNYHFFSEIFIQPGGRIVSAVLRPQQPPGAPLQFEDRGETWYVEGGHFDSLQELDAAYPNGSFAFDIEMSEGRLRHVSLRLEGPDGRTDLPAPIRISLIQQGVEVSPLQIDPSLDLQVRWSEYSNGVADPRDIVDDMIFVVIADCQGERLFHTGLPFQGEYLTFRASEVVVGAGTLAPGQPYSAFVEFPHVVDSRILAGVPGFTSYATATYLDLRTTGPASDAACPEVAPPMDTGQTDRMPSTRP